MKIENVSLCKDYSIGNVEHYSVDLYNARIYIDDGFYFYFGKYNDLIYARISDKASVIYFYKLEDLLKTGMGNTLGIKFKYYLSEYKSHLRQNKIESILV